MPNDAILQQKVKNKIYPSLKFISYLFEYNNLTIAVIEIPVSWYQSLPIPTVAIKGLEANRVYLRRSTVNDLANPDEIILLDNWLKSLSMLPESGKYYSVDEYMKSFNTKPIKKIVLLKLHLTKLIFKHFLVTKPQKMKI